MILSLFCSLIIYLNFVIVKYAINIILYMILFIYHIYLHIRRIHFHPSCLRILLRFKMEMLCQYFFWFLVISHGHHKIAKYFFLVTLKKLRVIIILQVSHNYTQHKTAKVFLFYIREWHSCVNNIPVRLKLISFNFSSHLD